MSLPTFASQSSVKVASFTNTVELASSVKTNSNNSMSENKHNSLIKSFHKLFYKIPNSALRKSKQSRKHAVIANVAPPNPQATFLGCPGEIRNQIYRYLFQDDPIVDRLRALRDRARLNINKNTHVLLVCRQIYEEASNLARPNFALNPKHFDLNVKCVAGLTLPFNNLHTARILQGATPPEFIKTLILRESIHDLHLYWEPPSGIPPLAINLQVETLIIQLCICRADVWRLGPFEDTVKFALALVQFLESLPSIQRAVVYFCTRAADGGLTTPILRTRFPNWVVEVIRAQESWSVNPSKPPGLLPPSYECNHTVALMSGSTGRQTVKLEFYDSRLTSWGLCAIR